MGPKFKKSVGEILLGPGIPFGHIFLRLKVALSSSSGKELICPHSSQRDILSFLFLVRSSLEISILHNIL